MHRREADDPIDVAVQLTEQWNQLAWDQVRELVTGGVPETEVKSVRRPAQPKQRQHRLHPEQVASLAADYRAGATIQELTVKYQVRHETVRRWLDVMEVPVRPPKIGVPTELIGEAVALHAAGWGWKRLAERYGCSSTAVRGTVRKAQGLGP